MQLALSEFHNTLGYTPYAKRQALIHDWLPQVKSTAVIVRMTSNPSVGSTATAREPHIRTEKFAGTSAVPLALGGREVERVRSFDTWVISGRVLGEFVVLFGRVPGTVPRLDSSGGSIVHFQTSCFPPLPPRYHPLCDVRHTFPKPVHRWPPSSRRRVFGRKGTPRTGRGARQGRQRRH